MPSIVARLIESGCTLYEELDVYLFTKRLGVCVSPDDGDKFCYYTRNHGSPYSCENGYYHSREFESKEEAAITALKDYGIINITEWGDAVFRPTRDNNEPRTCAKCKFFSNGVSFCAVNPLMFGRPNCPDREYALELPRQKINQNSPLTKALKAAGL